MKVKIKCENCGNNQQKQGCNSMGLYIRYCPKCGAWEILAPNYEEFMQKQKPKRDSKKLWRERESKRLQTYNELKEQKSDWQKSFTFFIFSFLIFFIIIFLIFSFYEKNL